MIDNLALIELQKSLDEGIINELEFNQYKCELDIAEYLEAFYRATNCIPLIHCERYGSGLGVSVVGLGPFDMHTK